MHLLPTPFSLPGPFLHFWYSTPFVIVSLLVHLSVSHVRELQGDRDFVVLYLISQSIYAYIYTYIALISRAGT